MICLYLRCKYLVVWGKKEYFVEIWDLEVGMSFQKTGKSPRVVGKAWFDSC